MKRMHSMMMVASWSMALASPTFAAISYNYVTDAPSYDASGGSATVKVYLQETLTLGSTSLLTSEGGIFGGGFKASLLSGGGIKFSAFAANPVMTGPGVATIDDTSIEANVTIPLGGTGPTPDVNGRILLGSMTMIPGGSGSAPATFALERIDDLGGYSLTHTNSYNLDSDSSSPTFHGATGQATFTVAVPEPASIALFSVLCGGLLARRRTSTLAVSI